MLDPQDHDGAVWKGVAAGLVAGFAASFAMNQFQALLQKAREAVSDQPPERHQQGQGKDDQNEGENATVKTAEAISESFGHRLSDEEKQAAGPAVHYAFGTVMGGVYGALAELSPTVAMGAGVPFGAAVWLGADEVALPLLGLSKKPGEYPPSVHVSALAAHAVYGLTTELVRRAILRAVD